MKEGHWKHCGRKIYKDQLVGYLVRPTAIIKKRGQNIVWLCPFCEIELNSNFYRFE